MSIQAENTGPSQRSKSARVTEPAMSLEEADSLLATSVPRLLHEVSIKRYKEVVLVLFLI